jgi:hypothetical protein
LQRFAEPDGHPYRCSDTGSPFPAAGCRLDPKEDGMGALRIIATVIMAVFFINIVRKLIIGEIKVGAWKNGTITNEDGAILELKSARSLRLNFGFLVIAMAAFLFAE